METTQYTHLCEAERYMIVTGLEAGPAYGRLQKTYRDPPPEFQGKYIGMEQMVMPPCWPTHRPKQGGINRGLSKSWILFFFCALMCLVKLTDIGPHNRSVRGLKWISLTIPICAFLTRQFMPTSTPCPNPNFVRH